MMGSRLVPANTARVRHVLGTVRSASAKTKQKSFSRYGGDGNIIVLTMMYLVIVAEKEGIR